MRVNVTLVTGEVEHGFIVPRRLLHALAQAVQVPTVAGLLELGEHLGDARPNAFDRGQLMGGVQPGEVGPLDRQRPGRCREGFRAEPLCGVLPQQVTDLRQDLGRRDRIHLSIV